MGSGAHQAPGAGRAPHSGRPGPCCTWSPCRPESGCTGGTGVTQGRPAAMGPPPALVPPAGRGRPGQGMVPSSHWPLLTSPTHPEKALALPPPTSFQPQAAPHPAACPPLGWGACAWRPGGSSITSRSSSLGRAALSTFSSLLSMRFTSGSWKLAILNRRARVPKYSVCWDFSTSL